MATEIKNNLNIWDYKEPCAWYRLDQKVASFFRKIKWMFQRAKYGWCDRDLWSLDYSLGNYIASSVEELANRTHGYPLGTTESQWDEILRAIALSFYLGTNEDAWTNIYESKLTYEPYSQLDEEGKAIWDKWFQEEREIDAAMEIRRQEGFQLLKQWFPNLWD